MEPNLTLESGTKKVPHQASIQDFTAGRVGQVKGHVSLEIRLMVKT